MSEDLLIRHCSPTLAGIKTGNLFSCACPSRKDLTRDLCRLNRKLVPKRNPRSCRFGFAKAAL